MSDLYRPLKEGYEFKGSEFFSEAWSLFKKEAGSFIGATVLFFIIYIAAAIIPLVNLLAPVVLTALMAGYFVYLRNMKNDTQKMGDFFGGFSSFGQIFLYLLMMILLIIPVGFAIFFGFFPFSELITSLDDPVGMSDRITSLFLENIGMLAMGILAFYAYAFYLTISFFVTIPLIVDAKLGFWQAMGLSRKVVSKKFFSFLGFYILFAIGSLILSVLTLGFGLLVIIPFYYILTWVVYDNIFKVGQDENVDEIESFGQTSSEINTESQERNQDQ